MKEIILFLVAAVFFPGSELLARPPQEGQSIRFTVAAVGPAGVVKSVALFIDPIHFESTIAGKKSIIAVNAIE